MSHSDSVNRSLIMRSGSVNLSSQHLYCCLPNSRTRAPSLPLPSKVERTTSRSVASAYQHQRGHHVSVRHASPFSLYSMPFPFSLLLCQPTSLAATIAVLLPLVT